MFDEIERFAVYLQDVKRMSQNTILSYRRDLLQFASYMEDRGVREAGKVTKTSLLYPFSGKREKGPCHYFAYAGLNQGIFSL